MSQKFIERLERIEFSLVNDFCVGPNQHKFLMVIASVINKLSTAIFQFFLSVLVS